MTLRFRIGGLDLRNSRAPDIPDWMPKTGVGGRNEMNKIRGISIAIAAGLCCYAPNLLADTASMQLTSAGPYTMSNVYVGPYTATINGVSTPVICDDFFDDSWLPEWWTANVYTPPNYSTTRDQQNSGFTGTALTQAYNEVGYLAVQLLNAASAPTPNATTIGEIDFALWSVFDPTALNSLSGSAYAAAQGYLTTAASYKNNSSFISQFTIYSPNMSYSVSCTPGGGACPDSPPQEFLVRTPEPSELALLGIDLSGVGALLFLVYRRRTNQV
jgi:hypothetical protein